MTTETGPGENSPGVTLPMGPLVADLFAAFDRDSVDWAVLRNAEGLPEYTRYDIDILIGPSQMRSAAQIVRQVAAKHEWKVLGRIDKRHYQCLMLMSPLPEEPGQQPQFLPIDLFSDLEYRGDRFSDTTAGLANRTKHASGVWMVRPGFDAATTAIKELLPHGTLKHNSRQGVTDGAHDDPEGFRGALDSIVGNELCQQMLDACRAADWPQLDSLSSEIRRAYRRYSPSHLWRRVHFLWKNLQHPFSPSVSMMVVMMAPDGSGKTTVVDRVMEGLYKRPFKATRYLRANFDILPELKHLKVLAGRLVGKKVVIKEPPPPGTRHSGMHTPHSPLRSMLYVVYYSLDLFLGRLKLRRMRAQWNLIFFDRYYYDYFFQRGNQNCPRWFLRLFDLLVPKPDLAVFLERDAREIYAGKPELTVEEIEREQDVIRRFLEDKSFGTIIDASQGVDSTIDELTRQIMHGVLSRLR